MDKDRIFINFEIPSSIEDEELIDLIPPKFSTLDYLDTYMVWCLRFIEFRDYFTTMNDQDKVEIDLEAAIESGAVYLNNKAWFYLKNINPDMKRSINAIKKLKDSYLESCLDFSISIFLQNEDYERCAILKKIKDVLQED